MALHIPKAGTHWLVPATLLTSSLLVTFSGESIQHLFIYDRNAIAAGEVWRLITAHLVHTGLEHWVLNVAALIVLWWHFNEDWASWRGVRLLLFPFDRGQCRIIYF